MKKIFILAIAISSFAQNSYAVANQNVNTSKLPRVTEKFVRLQVEQNVSIGRAIKTIVGHYPQQAASIVDTALDLYPDKYKEIIHSAISAQPTLADEVVTIALSKGITSCISIVETFRLNTDYYYLYV